VKYDFRQDMLDRLDELHGATPKAYCDLPKGCKPENWLK